MDVAGPWGGRDGLNQAILPAGAPISIYATGFRNAYDLVMTADGRLYTVDNGSNSNLGGNPAIVNGEATNQIVNGGTGSGEPLFLVEQGGYYGHPNPTRSNQNQSWTVYNDAGSPDTTPAVPTVSNISALRPGRGEHRRRLPHRPEQVHLEPGAPDRGGHPRAASERRQRGAGGHRLVEQRPRRVHGRQLRRRAQGRPARRAVQRQRRAAQPERHRHDRHLRDHPRPLGARDAARRHRRTRRHALGRRDRRRQDQRLRADRRHRAGRPRHRRRRHPERRRPVHPRRLERRPGLHPAEQDHRLGLRRQPRRQPPGSRRLWRRPDRGDDQRHHRLRRVLQRAGRVPAAEHQARQRQVHHRRRRRHHGDRERLDRLGHRHRQYRQVPVPHRRRPSRRPSRSSPSS